MLKKHIGHLKKMAFGKNKGKRQKTKNDTAKNKLFRPLWDMNKLYNKQKIIKNQHRTCHVNIQNVTPNI